jgi:hypothetical protein
MTMFGFATRSDENKPFLAIGFLEDEKLDNVACH